MENASKAMIIIGAVIITVLIISAALYLYGSSQGLLKTTGESISDQERLSFNQQWTYYDGEQTGDSIKDMLRKMMQNCSQNEKEESRLVGLKINKAREVDDIHELDVTIKVTGTVTTIEWEPGDIPLTYFEYVKPSNRTINLRPGEAKRMYALVRNAIETRHVYKVTHEYEKRGIIDKIVITY